MILKSLELRDFRNYETLHIDFDSGTNILYGDNAQGKTNILESIYVSGTTKSHKGSKDREMIRFDREESHIKSMIDREGLEYQIDIHIKKNHSKGIAINRVPIQKASELFGILNLVFFSPEDLRIVKNGPAQRRRFLDMELSQLDKIYLYDLAKYNKVLEQRNHLLRNLYTRPELMDTLDVWDQQLAEQGIKLIKARRSFIKDLNGMISDIHKKISGGRENIFLEYESDSTEEKLNEDIIKSRNRDIKLFQTNCGPHRDDISFLVNGIDIRRFGSQGQQRTAALSLKLSEIELIKRFKRETPILLLDDVLSELDDKRQDYLLNAISGIQTIITSTGLDGFMKDRFNINRIFQIVEGKVQ